jgi:UDP-N-acetylglucosamine/UDP-N-acetylgalactosamine diphosphorylase
MTRRPAADVESLLRAEGQEHLLPVFDSLDPAKAESFAAELRAVDFPLLKRLVREAAEGEPKGPAGEPQPPPTVKKGADPRADAAAAAVGVDLLLKGRVAALVVAGGQGSRLGHPGPKGTFPATPVKRKTLFRLFSEKIRALGRRYGKTPPLLVMTSEENHADTLAFFDANGRFGLSAEDVIFFTQGMLPAVDPSGKLVMKELGALFRSPNGHGGTLLALETSGVLSTLERRGIEEIFYFQVDNPLVEICDPVFLGGHALAGADFSSKTVAKAGPDEKVGVVVVRDGVAGVVEYSDLPETLRQARNPDGSLRFNAGNIAVHALRVDFVRRLNRDGFSLPYHVARKKLPCVGIDGRQYETPGLKFETFVFDALGLARKTYCLEVEREAEFAPIKNAVGVDSAESSSDLQSRSAARWLEAAGVRVPRRADGAPVQPIEISPLFADSAAALRERKIGPLSFDKPVYLDEPAT